MLKLEQTSLDIIGHHLLRMGGGNHRDNMGRLGRFDCHCLVSLAEEEFLDLVFLQSHDVLTIAPRGHDRKLREVARRAIELGQPKLADNWDLATNLCQMRERVGKSSSQEAVVICEARDGEERHGRWYLQDGAHRGIAYATLVLLNEMQYEQQMAYCSMSEAMYEKQFNRPEKPPTGVVTSNSQETVT